MSAPTPRRIESAEATEYPWWVIIDPARAMLPHPIDISDPADTDCAVCGAFAGEPCVQTDEEESPGAERDEFHVDGRHDYRDEVSAEDLAPVMTGPFFSRGAAAAYLREKEHRFSSRARVWCASGHESGDWRAFCAELPVVGRDEELNTLRDQVFVAKRRGAETAHMLRLERDEARDLLRQVAVALGCPDQAPGDLPSSVEALRLQRDRLRAERDAALAVVERVRPVVKALAVAYGTEAGCPEYRRNWLTHLMNALGRRFTTYADDAAWLRSLLAPQPQDDR